MQTSDLTMGVDLCSAASEPGFTAITSPLQRDFMKPSKLVSEFPQLTQQWFFHTPVNMLFLSTLVGPS